MRYVVLHQHFTSKLKRSFCVAKPLSRGGGEEEEAEWKLQRHLHLSNKYT
jgi:hypothetical protein